MFTVLLADDELLDREGLYHQIPWESLNVHQVYMAKNAREALLLMQENTVDILLTDISMPGMSGLELAKEVTELYPLIKIIFISGYDDFSYAQKAVSLNAYGYVLKPVETEEFIRVFNKAVQDIQQEKTKQIVLSKIENKAKRGEFLEFSKNIYEFVVYAHFKSYTVNLIESKLGAEMNNYGIVLIEIDDYYQWISDIMPEEAFAAIEIFIRESEKPIPGFSFFIAEMKPSRYALIYSSPKGMTIPKESLEALSDSVKKLCGFSTTISVSGTVPQLTMLPQVYKICRNLLLQKVFVGAGQVIKQNVGDISKGLSIGSLIEQLNKEILQCVKNVDSNHLLAFIEAVFDDIEKSAIFPLIIVKNLSIHIISRTQIALIEENLGVDFLQETILWERIIHSPSLNTLRDVVTDYFEQVALELSGRKEQHYWSTASKITEYIEEHYGEDITLKSIAPLFYYSPNHLGVLFKEVTGKTFREYLTQYRMEVAAELLKSSSMYVYEVANHVSYKNAISFSNQFKKEYGLRPAEYSARYRR